MIVAAREFTSAAEMRAHSVAVHQRCFHPKAKPAPKVDAVRLIAPTPYKPPAPVVIPSWQLAPTMFEEHIFAYRANLKIREMIAAGEIEMIYADRPDIKDIVTEFLADYPEFTVSDLKRQPQGSAALTLVRQRAMYHVRQQRPDLSLAKIGQWFGGRDHSTVHHAVKKIEAERGAA
jgi:hypothetical protein